MAAKFPPCPPTLKSIAHYLNVAQEHGTQQKRTMITIFWKIDSTVASIRQQNQIENDVIIKQFRLL